MNLTKLFELQRKLDEHIIKEKGLEGEDLLPKKILALQVELGELANEARFFKFWSEDQEPRTEVRCHCCKGKGFFDFTEPFTNEHFTEDCGYCDGTGIQDKNPLLEEYVDCLHFILSIGLELDEKPRFNFQLVKQENITDAFLDLFQLVGELDIISKETTVFDYDILFMRFYELGIMLGFTWEQIEQSYLDKNKINHERQRSGY